MQRYKVCACCLGQRQRVKVQGAVIIDRARHEFTYEHGLV